MKVSREIKAAIITTTQMERPTVSRVMKGNPVIRGAEVPQSILSKLCNRSATPAIN